MAAQNHFAAVLDQLFNGGKSCHDTLIVGDLAIFHGDVKVAAYKNPLAAYLNVVNCLLGHVD